MSLVALCTCALGEFLLDNCTDARNATCWPCPADHFCLNGTQTPCPLGHWAPRQSGECRPCPPGMECGPHGMRRCGIGTFADRGRCVMCTHCRQLTTTRCNSTHDSVCGKTTLPLSVVKVHQEFRTDAPGELFGVFALIYASALPRSRLERVCDQKRCVDCFQGACPVAEMGRLVGPGYRLTIEVRPGGAAAFSNSAFLLETAKDTMRKLTDAPFVAYTRVEHSVICPDGLQWDGTRCAAEAPRSTRTWMGLVAGVLLLAAIGLRPCSNRRA